MNLKITCTRHAKVEMVRREDEYLARPFLRENMQVVAYGIGGALVVATCLGVSRVKYAQGFIAAVGRKVPAVV